MRYVQNGNPFADAARLSGRRPIACIFDIGANVGEVTEHLLANFPDGQVFAFEPCRGSFSAMQERHAGNSRVIPHNLGMADRCGKETLNLYGDSGLNSTLPMLPSGCLAEFDTLATGSAQIAMTTIDDFCGSVGMETVDFIKIDIQGTEIRCLRGAERMLKRSAIRFIYTEVLFAPLYDGQPMYEDIAAYLRNFGFRMFSLYAMSFDDGGQLCWADALFTLEEP